MSSKCPSVVQPVCLASSKSLEPDSSSSNGRHFSSPPVKLFSVAATLTSTDPAIIFSLLHQGEEHQAVLHQTFLTALELDGVTIAWEEARTALVAGTKARVDITQVRQASTGHDWLVFGLYLDTALLTVSVEDGFFSSDWVEASEEDSHECLVEDENFGQGLNQTLNQTFTIDEKLSLQDRMCDHKYEVGVVVVTISSQFLHLIVQCGDTWSRTDVDPLDSLVLVEGIRTKEVFSIKMGAMGHMVTKKCVKCQVDDLSPSLLWFGEKQCPSVREQAGVVVGKKGDRVVVQMEDSDMMVLFHGEIFKEDFEMSSKVLVWAWSKVFQGGVGSFLEGVALVVLADDEEKTGDVVGDDTYDLLELSTDGIFSPIRSKFDEEDDCSRIDGKDQDVMDVSLSVSFGSVSGQSDDGKENFSTMVNPDRSSNYMRDVSLPNDVKEDTNDFLDEIYFQSLFWRSSSPKPDAIIDAQFTNILSANDILHNYDALMTDFDQITSANTILQTDHTSSSLNQTPDLCDSLEPESPAFFMMLKPITRKMSPPPLSPIPEETTADREASDLVEDPVFTAAWPGAASTPAGRRDTYQEGSLPTPDSSYQLPTSMDSGFYDSFSSGMSTSVPSSSVKSTRVVLEQFLEFTNFPRGEQPAIIDSFLAYLDVEQI